nr:MAG TPA: hypothetical protein [Caudoviricetes sp.]DAY66957.1 MAG TPA: hypothetical protein [Caudoviricetes sp.]
METANDDAAGLCLCFPSSCGSERILAVRTVE